jgi:hypothetical protein
MWLYTWDIILVLYEKENIIRTENISNNVFIVALKGFVNYIIEGENIRSSYTSSP